MKWAYRAKLLLFCITHFLKMKLQIPKSLSHPVLQINASPKFCFVRYHFFIAKYTNYIPKLDTASTSCIHFKRCFFRLVYNKSITKNAFRTCNASPKTEETHFLLFTLQYKGSSTVFLEERSKKRCQSTAPRTLSKFS